MEVSPSLILADKMIELYKYNWASVTIHGSTIDELSRPGTRTVASFCYLSMSISRGTQAVYSSLFKVHVKLEGRVGNHNKKIEKALPAFAKYISIVTDYSCSKLCKEMHILYGCVLPWQLTLVNFSPFLSTQHSVNIYCPWGKHQTPPDQTPPDSFFFFF